MPNRKATSLFSYLTQNNLLILIPLGLTLFGIFMIYEASSINAAYIYNDSFYFIKSQIIWFFLASGVFLFCYHFDYHFLYTLALALLLVNLVLLLLVFIPGLYTTALGAKRWLKLGPVRLQPSEFTKVSLIVYLSAWFSYKERNRFFAFLTLTAIIIFLVMLQPDLGTASIIGATAVFLYFISDAPFAHFLILIPLAALLFLAMAIASPYRLHRLQTFLFPEQKQESLGYHVKQINIALSLGGLWGTGYGFSKQKFQYLPESHTDSIFAIIGENFGFIGTTVIVIVFLVFIFNAIERIPKIRDRLGFLLASGITFLIALQALINLAAMVQLVPLVGVPLPFISYGGSSLLTFYALVGILLNIFRKNGIS
jgi:cell division protein FtsW